MYASFEDLLATSKHGFYNKMTTCITCWIACLQGIAMAAILSTCTATIPTISYYQEQHINVFYVLNCFFVGQILGFLTLGCLVDTNGRLTMMNFGLQFLPICMIGLAQSTNLGFVYTYILATCALLAGFTIATRVYFVEFSMIQTRGKSYFSLAIAYYLGSSIPLLLFVKDTSMLFDSQLLFSCLAVFGVICLVLQLSIFLHPSLRFLLYKRQRIGGRLRHIYTLNTIQHERDYEVPKKVAARKLIEITSLKEALTGNSELHQIKKKAVSLFSNGYVNQTLCLLFVSSIVWANTLHSDFLLLNVVIYYCAKDQASPPKGLENYLMTTSYLPPAMKALTRAQVVTLCISPILGVLALKPISDQMKRTSVLSSIVLLHAILLCTMYGLMRSDSVSMTTTHFTIFLCFILAVSSGSAILLELIILENVPTKMRGIGLSMFKIFGMILFMILFDCSLMSSEYFFTINAIVLLAVCFIVAKINDQSKRPMLEFINYPTNESI